MRRADCRGLVLRIDRTRLKGYLLEIRKNSDTIVQANGHGLISNHLFQRLKPFFDFRNSLIHRYWAVDDYKLIGNIVTGHADFDRFVEEIETIIDKTGYNGE